MSKHSPGPWVWQGQHRDGAAVLYACGDEKRRLVKAASSPALSDADAILIAAAPEMLALLQRLVHANDPTAETEAIALLKRLA